MKHKTIDWTLSITLANNKPQVAEELLTMLVESLPKFQQDIIDAFQLGDMQKLRAHVHKLHGGACYVGVPYLKEITAEIESMIKTNKTNNLDKQIANLTITISNILTEYKQQNFR